MLLQLNKIFKGYGDKGHSNYHPVIKGISLSIDGGERVAIAGPSGSGKTTLLNIAGALDKPDSGEVVFKGNELQDYSPKQLAMFRNSELGFIFQMHHLLPQCTLWENVLLPTIPFKKKANKVDIEWAGHLLKRVGIWEQRHRKPSELSGGECQRTAVVRALVNRPQLLLADEPTGALDEENAENLTELLISLSNEESVTMIVVTHSQALAGKMDKVYYLKNGVLS